MLEHTRGQLAETINNNGPARFQWAEHNIVAYRQLNPGYRIVAALVRGLQQQLTGALSIPSAAT
ncbi:MAG: hypothetical protein P4L84_00160, partial [Isosphaeraceae bacterium]|nr:hypothetical protein [Isosphaeraceae bacterium]